MEKMSIVKFVCDLCGKVQVWKGNRNSIVIKGMGKIFHESNCCNLCRKAIVKKIKIFRHYKKSINGD